MTTEKSVENLLNIIHESYSKSVFLYALGQTQNMHFAEEITQNTFVKIFTRVKTDRLLQMAKEEKENGKSALELFIFRVAKRCVIDFTRSSDYKSFKRNSALEPIHEKSEETNYGQPFSDEMQAALKTLPPLWEQVLKLYVLEDYSHKEIADELNIGEGHSKNCLSQAKKKLRQLLTKNKDGINPK